MQGSGGMEQSRDNFALILTGSSGCWGETAGSRAGAEAGGPCPGPGSMVVGPDWEPAELEKSPDLGS